MLKLIASGALSIILSFQLKAQFCNPVSNTPPVGVDFGHSSGGYQVFQNNKTVFMESVDYFFTSTRPPVLNISYDLASSSAANPQVAAYKATLFYRSVNGVIAQECSNTNSFTVNSQTPGTFYFSVPTDGVPVNTRFYVRLTFTVANTSNANIIGNNIKLTSNAIQLPVNSTLPVHFTTLEAGRSGNIRVVSWNVTEESNALNYELEKSTDGRSFSKIGLVKATNAQHYSLNDALSDQTVYYRVKNNDLDGRFQFSPVLKVEGEKTSYQARLYPSPVQSELVVQHGYVKQPTIITIFAADGRSIVHTTALPGTLETKIDLGGVSSGTYFLRFKDAIGKTQALKVIRQ